MSRTKLILEGLVQALGHVSRVTCHDKAKHVQLSCLKCEHEGNRHNDFVSAVIEMVMTMEMLKLYVTIVPFVANKIFCTEINVVVPENVNVDRIVVFVPNLSAFSYIHM